MANLDWVTWVCARAPEQMNKKAPENYDIVYVIFFFFPYICLDYTEY